MEPRTPITEVSVSQWPLEQRAGGPQFERYEKVPRAGFDTAPRLKTTLYRPGLKYYLLIAGLTRGEQNKVQRFKLAAPKIQRLLCPVLNVGTLAVHRGALMVLG
jgi:hypothetical protein